MKNKIKFLTIITVIAIIGFKIVACKQPETELANQNPVASDFIIGNLTQTVGIITPVTINPKAGKSTGTITVFYNGSTALPTAAGTYTVTFDVAAVSGWNAANGLSAGILTVNVQINAQTPSIVSQPTDSTITVNAPHSLSVEAIVTDGGLLSYQWYSNTSASNSGGTAITGATSYIYNPPTNKVGIFYYFVEVTNTVSYNVYGGNKTASIRSNAITLTVNTKVNAQTPIITSQPTDATVTFNASYSLSVVASVDDEGTLSYKWYSNTGMSNSGGTVITGAASATYNLPTGAAGTYYYFAEVINTISDNGDGGVKTTSIRSYVVQIIVASPSVIVIDLAGINEWQLIEQTAQTNSSEFIMFTVTGTYRTYRWYLDGESVGTSLSYIFNKPAGVYQLAVVVTNSSGESRSGRCRITVTGTSDGSETKPFPLTINTWINGNITSTTSTVWYSFFVTSGTTYCVWWNDAYDGNSTKTLDVRVSATYSSGTSIFTGIDSGWSTAQSFTANQTGIVKIRVVPYSSGTGTFAVAYSTSSTRP